MSRSCIDALQSALVARLAEAHSSVVLYKKEYSYSSAHSVQYMAGGLMCKSVYNAKKCPTEKKTRKKGITCLESKLLYSCSYCFPHVLAPFSSPFSIFLHAAVQLPKKGGKTKK